VPNLAPSVHSRKVTSSNGKIVEDPEAAPIIRDIFKLYVTGRYGVRSLVDYLNRHGVGPAGAALARPTTTAPPP